MFSTTKVTTLLLTSLLTFLAIELMVMWDTSKFKERFNKWKQGLPVYKNGKPISNEVSYNTPEHNFQEAIDYAASSKKINTTKLPKFGDGMTPDTIK